MEEILSPGDHDVLITIASDMRHMVEWTKSHERDDEIKHSANNKRLDAISRAVGFQSKIIYGALGIIAFVKFMTHF